MIRIVAISVITGVLYLVLMGEVARRDEITLQQPAELGERRT